VTALQRSDCLRCSASGLHLVFLLFNAASLSVLCCPATAALHHTRPQSANRRLELTNSLACSFVIVERYGMVSEPLPVISPRRFLQDSVGPWFYRKQEQLLASLPCLHCHRFFLAELTDPVLFSRRLNCGAAVKCVTNKQSIRSATLVVFWVASTPLSSSLVPACGFRVRVHLQLHGRSGSFGISFTIYRL
jgi:hypothetical protein